MSRDTSESVLLAREEHKQKSNATIDALIHEANLGPEEEPTFLLELSGRWTSRLINSGGDREYLWDAAIVTARAISRHQHDGSKLRQLHVAMSSIFARASDWHSSPPVDVKDFLDTAIHHETLALALCEHASDDSCDHLQVLSSLHAQLYEHFRERKDLKEAVRFLNQAAKLMEEPYSGVAGAIAATLLFMEDDTALQTVKEVPFDFIHTSPVSISHADRQCFRFIDCRALVERKSLRIVELHELPWAKYAALSYPWRGLENVESDSVRFTIDGAGDADPVNLDVLIIACEAALQLKCPLLWFDALCIKQDDLEDKAWQIERMYSVYKHCRECLIFPGGLTRLAAIDEPTPWIDRAWTLQEAVAPASSRVVFTWNLGPVLLQSFFGILIEEIVPGKAGMTTLRSVLEMAGREPDVLHKTPSGSYAAKADKTTAHVAILGDNANARMALLGALDHKSNQRHLGRPLSLGRIITKSVDGEEMNEEGFANAIWRAAMLRIASRSIDAVFSIMGLFNVVLNPRAYEVNERVRATIDLMRGSLEQGYRAEWLGISPNLPLHEEISTIPAFPSYNSEGKLVVRSHGGETDVPLYLGGGWKLCDAPAGSVTFQGLFRFSAKAAPVQRMEAGRKRRKGETTFGSLSTNRTRPWDVVDGHEWLILPQLKSTTTYAVSVGTKQQYSNGSMPRYVDPWDNLLMLVEKDPLVGYRNLCFANVRKEVLEHPSWCEQTIEVC